MEPDRLIAGRRTELMQLFAAFDAERFRDLVTHDVIWVPPHGPPQFGAAALVDWLSPFFEDYAYELFLEPARLSSSPDGAIEHGQVISRISPKDPTAAPADNVSTYLIVWRVSGGVWRVGLFCDVAALATPRR